MAAGGRDRIPIADLTPMKDRYLEVTFRKGKPLAAYLYLPRQQNATSARTELVGAGLVADI
jgi:hypothetical protein